jgi:hypothetical protein
MIALIIAILTIVIAASQLFVALSVKAGSKRRDIHKDTNLKCEYFQSKIIPLYKELIKYHDKNKINLLTDVYFNKETGILTKPYKPSPKYPDFLDKAEALFNEMDAFAAFIIDKTLSDSDMAFKMQGRAFCDIINKLKVVYDIFLTTNKEDYYSLERLYDLWIVKYIPRNVIVEYSLNSNIDKQMPATNMRYSQ